jgi:hypothetical protein
MLVVNEKLAFVLIPKNASTSIRAFYGVPLTPEKIVESKVAGISLNETVQSFNFGRAKILTTNEYEKDKFSEHVNIRTILNTNTLNKDTRIISVIRNPIERQLSLYMFRHKYKKYNTKISVEDFRKRIADGFLLDRSPWQMKLQTWFTYHNDKIVEYWKYEDVNQKFLEFGTLDSVNCSFNHNLKKTSDLVDIFYDQHSKLAVQKYWKRDFELYESIN